MNSKLFKLALVTLGIFLTAGVNSFSQVRSWGYNSDGQLGNGNRIDQPAPVNVGQSQTTGIGGGAYHTLLLQANGTVLASGDNDDGQLGDGTNFMRVTPVMVFGISSAAAVAGGRYHSLALLADGTVRAWGSNSFGQLGDGTNTGKFTPVAVPGLTNVVAVAGGHYFSLALRSDGTVWAWGENDTGQLGDNTTTGRNAPVQVSGLTNVVAVSAGANHGTALKADGTVWVWGSNGSGQFGNNTSGNYSIVPVPATITGVSQIAAGSNHNLILKPDGTVWVWGNNYYGQIGDGTTGGDHPVPVQNTSIANAIDIRNNGDTNYVRLRDGSLRAWGSNTKGQIGNGTTSPNFPNSVSAPVQISVGTGNAVLGAGYFHALVSNPQITTVIGANQILQGDSVRIKFDSVSAVGTTAYTAIDPTTYSSPLPDYTISAGEPAYNISTTAAFSGNAEICIQLNGDYDPAVLTRLRVLHAEMGVFYDRTTTIDLRTRRICAATTALTPFSPFLIARSSLATAAKASISGKVIANAKGLANARVELTGTGGRLLTVTTNSFGNFTIDDVDAGATYVLNVSAKKYTFAPQVVSVTDNISGLNFTAQ